MLEDPGEKAEANAEESADHVRVAIRHALPAHPSSPGEGVRPASGRMDEMLRQALCSLQQVPVMDGPPRSCFGMHC